MSEFKTNKISPRKGTTQTIGDSGDTVSIASGVTVTNAGTITTAGISGGTINNTTGTISGLRGQVEWDTTAKTTAFTAVSNKGYFCNTTSAAFTVTLPASPSAGDVIALKDYANTFDTNNLTLNPNGNKIQGSTENFIISVEGANSQFIYVDATRGWVLTDASKASDIAEAPSFINATGGTITCCGDYKIHTFTSPGTFAVSSVGNCVTPAPERDKVNTLIIAGGGGGGWGDGCSPGGAGGAGGYRFNCSLTVTATSYPITVGAGGAAGPTTPNSPPNAGANGSNTIFLSITSSGGGGGGGSGTPPGNTRVSGSPGGSGGGGSESNPDVTPTQPGGTGNTPPVAPPQGNPGGNGVLNSAGGGGGAGGSGGNASSCGPGGNAGTGSSAWPGDATVRASGGAGGGYNSDGSTSTGGGGAANTAGTANTGGGGGGRSPRGSNAGAGGSGIVIIRYKYQ